jgi:hypothetical protein
MRIQTVGTPLEGFLFYGCWNRTGCAPGSPDAAVAAKVAEEDPSFPLVLAGDNVYPDKIGKKKVYSKTRLRSGIACLPKRTVYAALGNHNIAAPSIRREEFKQGREGAWYLPFSYYAVVFSNRKALIVLNSNLLEESHRQMEGMMKWFHETLGQLEEAGIAYYLIQHHPIVSRKKSSLYVLPHYEILLDCMMLYPPISILAADTHNYQSGIISYKETSFHQIVAGTGGASPDPILELEGPVVFDGTYTMLESDTPYGYVRIQDDKHEYRKVVSGGFTRKKKKRTLLHNRSRRRV